MSDMGNHEQRYVAKAGNLIDCLSLKAEDKLLISSQRLSSGAEIHVVIKLPK